MLPKRLIDWWPRLSSSEAAKPALRLVRSSDGLSSDPGGVLSIDFPECLRNEFPVEFPFAWSALEDILKTIAGTDLSRLARRSPGLRGFDWTAYLRCSTARVVRVLRALKSLPHRPTRVLDFGSYFGNFALALKRAGFGVDALDSYAEYGEALAPVQQVLVEAGANVIDFSSVGQDLSGLALLDYDAVLCMGVVEHIPHTPRLLLEALYRVLRPGGLLLLDTPNLAYLYTRQRLQAGQSIMTPIEMQYHTQLPFEGHHREYTLAEVRWMMQAAGFERTQHEVFNYGVYMHQQLTGHDLANYRLMQADESLREVIFIKACRPVAAANGGGGQIPDDSATTPRPIL